MERFKAFRGEFQIILWSVSRCFVESFEAFPLDRDQGGREAIPFRGVSAQRRFVERFVEVFVERFVEAFVELRTAFQGCVSCSTKTKTFGIGFSSTNCKARELKMEKMSETTNSN